MSAQPLSFDRSNRERSLTMLDQLQMGVAKTAETTAKAPAVGVHPRAGEMMVIPKEQLGVLLTQFFVTTEFARDMVEQLQMLERGTGRLASEFDITKYAGVTIPRGVEEVVVFERTLYAVTTVESTIMPGTRIPSRIPIAAADEPTGGGEIFGIDTLYAAAAAFAAAHPKESK